MYSEGSQKFYNLILQKILFAPSSRLEIRPRGKRERDRKRERARSASGGFSRWETQTDVLTDIFLAGQSVLLARRTTLRTPRRASANLGKWVNIYIVRSTADLPFLVNREISRSQKNAERVRKEFPFYSCGRCYATFRRKIIPQTSGQDASPALFRETTARQLS